MTPLRYCHVKLVHNLINSQVLPAAGSVYAAIIYFHHIKSLFVLTLVGCVDDNYQVFWQVISVEVEDAVLARALRGVLVESSPNSQHSVVLMVATRILDQAMVLCRNVDRRAQIEGARHDHIPYGKGEFVLL
jgi:hypothetical protein